MGRAWTRNGRLLLRNGRALVGECPECPCAAPEVCVDTAVCPNPLPEQMLLTFQQFYAYDPSFGTQNDYLTDDCRRQAVLTWNGSDGWEGTMDWGSGSNTFKVYHDGSNVVLRRTAGASCDINDGVNSLDGGLAMVGFPIGCVTVGEGCSGAASYFLQCKLFSGTPPSNRCCSEGGPFGGPPLTPNAAEGDFQFSRIEGIPMALVDGGGYGLIPQRLVGALTGTCNATLVALWTAFNFGVWLEPYTIGIVPTEAIGMTIQDQGDGKFTVTLRTSTGSETQTNLVPDSVYPFQLTMTLATTAGSCAVGDILVVVDGT